MDLEENPNHTDKDKENYKKISMIAMINIVLTIVSLGKDMLLAGYLGTSAQADSFVLAFFIIDTIGNNLLATALGMSIIPVFADLQANKQYFRIFRLTQFLVAISLVITTVLALLMYELRAELLSLVGSGLQGASREVSISLLCVFIPSLIVFPLINLGISILQVRNRFNIPAFAPVLYNTVLIIGLILMRNLEIPQVTGVYYLALFTSAGVITMLVYVWYPIISKSESKNNNADQQKSLAVDLLTIGKNFLPYLLTILFTQLTYLVERYFASQLESGSIAGLSYAFRLVQFPLWVFVAALSSVLFPIMAKVFALGQKDRFNELLTNSIFITLVITLPLTIILFVLRVPIVSIMLQRGEFSSYSVAITTNIMAGYTFTIIWQGFAVILVRAALTSGRVYIALLAAAFSAVATLSFDAKFVPILGAASLGFGATLGALVNFFILYSLYFSSFKWKMTYAIKFMKILVANLPLLMLALFFSRLWDYVEQTQLIFAYQFGYALLVIVVCLPVYWLSLKICRVSL